MTSENIAIDDPAEVLRRYRQECFDPAYYQFLIERIERLRGVVGAEYPLRDAINVLRRVHRELTFGEDPIGARVASATHADRDVVVGTHWPRDLEEAQMAVEALRDNAISLRELQAQPFAPVDVAYHLWNVHENMRYLREIVGAIPGRDSESAQADLSGLAEAVDRAFELLPESLRIGVQDPPLTTAIAEDWFASAAEGGRELYYQEFRDRAAFVQEIARVLTLDAAAGEGQPSLAAETVAYGTAGELIRDTFGALEPELAYENDAPLENTHAVIRQLTAEQLRERLNDFAAEVRLWSRGALQAEWIYRVGDDQEVPAENLEYAFQRLNAGLQSRVPQMATALQDHSPRPARFRMP